MEPRLNWRQRWLLEKRNCLTSIGLRLNRRFRMFSPHQGLRNLDPAWCWSQPPNLLYLFENL